MNSLLFGILLRYLILIILGLLVCDGRAEGLKCSQAYALLLLVFVLGLSYSCYRVGLTIYIYIYIYILRYYTVMYVALCHNV